ncbi:MAG: YdiU family protein [Zetaproteobacteria bacterium]|nr:YdiU family protein [Zetaproteobacteria bacterium]
MPDRNKPCGDRVELQNSYVKLPDRFYQKICPEKFSDPKLVLFNHDLADELGLNLSDASEIAQLCSGQRLLPGSQPIAQAYAGSQFGHFSPQLGDGRAHLLGELKGLDLQLKGSGRTRFSRRGDGRSPLGPAIREFLVSEAMHALGVPTTRSLSVVTTGETVYRQDGPTPGAILARVAESHLRVGTFQYFASQGDLEALEILTNYTIKRHYPGIRSTQISDCCLELLRLFAERQGDLVARWYALGFIHGVMNTDNCSMAGITIDYGPCAFLDEFHQMKVFSSIDKFGRYAYGNQMAIVEWNIHRLADCLLPLIADDPQRAVSMAEQVLEEPLASFHNRLYLGFARKLGLKSLPEEGHTLVIDFLRYLQAHSLDFTLSFSHLRSLYEGDTHFYPVTSELHSFLSRWKALDPDLYQMDSINPRLIPRNHQIEKVITHANQGDYQPFEQMWEALKSPFEVSEEYGYLMDAPKMSERVYQTFCGT